MRKLCCQPALRGSLPCPPGLKALTALMAPKIVTPCPRNPELTAPRSLLILPLPQMVTGELWPQG
jgi:hypothetical protein